MAQPTPLQSCLWGRPIRLTRWQVNQPAATFTPLDTAILHAAYGRSVIVKVVGELGPGERDSKVGPVFWIELPDGDRLEAYQDELNPEPESDTLQDDGAGGWIER